MHPLIASAATDAFTNVLSVLNLIVQVAMFCAAAWAAYYAREAFRTQDDTLSRLIQDRKDEIDRKRIADSPFFEADWEVNVEAEELDCGGYIHLAGFALTYNLHNSLKHRLKEMESDEPVRFHVAIRNLRPQNEVMAMRARITDDLDGVSGCEVSKVKRLKLYGKPPIKGDYWVVGYQATAHHILEKDVTVEVEFEFETLSGHRDTHRYRHKLGTLDWKRTEPKAL